MNCFFDPTSKKSGIKYQKSCNKKLIGTEITDRTVYENFCYQINRYSKSIDLMPGYFTFVPFETIMGSHYYTSGLFDDNEYGAKGLLDFLIFPLVARKILTDFRAFINDINHYEFNNASAFIKNGGLWLVYLCGLMIGISLELARISLGIALTFVALMAAVAVISVAAVVATPCAIAAGCLYLIYQAGVMIKDCVVDVCRIDSVKTETPTPQLN